MAIKQTQLNDCKNRITELIESRKEVMVKHVLNGNFAQADASAEAIIRYERILEIAKRTKAV